MSAEQILSEAVALVRECLADGKLDASEILRIGVFAAQKANTLKALSGPQKKEFVLSTVRKAIETAVPAEQREQVGYTTALQVLPTVLDIAVAAAHGKLALKRVSADCLAGCFSGLWKARKNSAAAVAVLSSAVSVVAAPLVPAPLVPAPLVPAPESTPPVGASQESAPVAAPQKEEPKDTTPPKESPTEPSPQEPAEASPQETRQPEAVAIEPPSTATPLAPVPEETPVA